MESRPQLNKTTEFTVPGIPKGQKRARFSAVTGFVKAYKPTENTQRENLIALAYKQAEPDIPPCECAVKLTLYAKFLVPKSWSKKKRENPGYKVSKPDLDNIVKSVKDGLNRVAWVDDSQVVTIDAEKVYGDRDEMVVIIERLGDD